VIARKLVWSFAEGDRVATGAWLDGRLVDADDRALGWLTDEARVRLWHPIGSAPEAVFAWRLWLERHGVTQPFKQAHREVYILTDAERQTEVYSSRFAAHILRQHQLQALCQQRGWSYRLQGAFDGANAPTLELPKWGLRAEFWVDELAGGPTSPAGIWLYVSTDQVRFYRLPSAEQRGHARRADLLQAMLSGRAAALPTVLPVAEVPPLVFSEVMRDVDLFVGVASVGNDPLWRDAGLAHHRDYWQSYSFGELGDSARSRRDVLERIVPRLKIAPRCTLAERFLVVRGDLRTYKIHLGSGNVLMEPNDQYLCIVQGRPAVGQSAPVQVFLPFEGDGTLSIILSKAFLLADDRSIKDPTIVRQITGG
jgi:hypothetical protein